MTARRALLLLVCVACSVAGCEVPDPTYSEHVYLTWAEDDTGTTITVNYHTRDAFDGSTVHYDTVSRGGDPDRYALRAVGDAPPTKLWRVRRYIHHVTLRGLAPDTTYYFVAGDPRAGFTAEKRFHTLPGGDRPLRFVEGADMDVDRRVPPLLRAAATTHPMFALVAGDLAYANGNLSKLGKWDSWFRNWEENMVTPEGDLIPMVVALGNHDVGRWTSPFYQPFFDQDAGGLTYFARRFGTQTIVLVLDSDHVASQGGAQRRWLEATLRTYADLPCKIALYHVPLYPAHYAFDLPKAAAGRRYWEPLFDRFGLTLALEAHDHTYKRTVPLRDGKPVDHGGVVYAGGGPWGGHPKTAHPDRPYLHIAESVRHFLVADVTDGHIHVEARTVDGRVIDSFTVGRPSPGTAAAPAPSN
jgi:Purple acid Phosphatase, N-terminal domain/Calcineurin-like phosphoesterase